MKWTRYERWFLILCYSHASTKAVAAHLGRSVSSILNMANLMRLKKSPEALRAPGVRMGRVNGAKYGFKSGQEPWNKGMEYRPAGSEKTWFQKGNMPKTWRPIGSVRIGRDGYRYRKVSDTRCRAKDWRMEHVLLWEQHYGPVPEGHIVVFKNRNNQDVRIENLECITRAENMSRNQYQRYPEPVARAIQLRGALNRQINQRQRA